MKRAFCIGLTFTAAIVATGAACVVVPPLLVCRSNRGCSLLRAARILFAPFNREGECQ